MAFEFRLLNDISRAFSPELPRDLGTMDQHLDFILPKIIPYGEDLREEHFWLNKRWKEVRDDEGFHEAILHIFSSGGEYLLSLDGNLVKGTWKKLGEENSLIIDLAGRSELFDLRFMNGEFIVLTKHGDQARKGQRKYFCLIQERSSRGPRGQEFDWRNVMEKLFNVWRDNSLGLWAWLLFLGLIAMFIYLSVN